LRYIEAEKLILVNSQKMNLIQERWDQELQEGVLLNSKV